jgi:hypothetical protein
MRPLPRPCESVRLRNQYTSKLFVDVWVCTSLTVSPVFPRTAFEFEHMIRIWINTLIILLFLVISVGLEPTTP